MRLEPAKRLRRMLPLVAVLLASPLLGAASEPVREPAFELAGLAKLEGDESFALLQEPELTNGAPVFVRQGQSIGPYRLIAIEEDRVLLESSTGVITVLLGGSKDGSGAVAVVPPPKPEPEARMTAEESVAAELKGTPGGKLLDILKNAFGLGAKQ